MSMDTLRKGRNMPFLKKGMRVQVHNGKFGTITGANHQMNINVRLDGEKKSGNYHPQWNIRYFDRSGKRIAEYRD